MNYTNKKMLGHFDDYMERVVIRVKVETDGAGDHRSAHYNSGTSVVADTTLRPDLTGQTVSQLTALCGPSSAYAMAESRAIYRNIVGGTTASLMTIPLATVNKTAIVGGFGIITTGFGGTSSFSVGVPGNTGFILGAVVGTVLAVESGATTAIWNSTYPYSTSTPTASGVGAGRLYYAADKIVSPGTPINLYLTAADVAVIGAGDITFELFATPFGKESYGETDGFSTQQATKGKDIRTIIPKF